MPIKQTIPTNSSDSVQFGNATTPVAAQITGAEVSTGNGYLAMSTTAGGTVTERMRIDSSGNVGIGTSSPGGKLHLDTTNDTIFRMNTSGTNIGYLEAYTGGATPLFAMYSVPANGNMTFGTANTERMRIDSSGNVLVGTSTTTATPTSGFTALINSGSSYFNIGHVSGTGSGTGYQQYLYNGGLIGSITQNGTTGVLYNITSDQRLKENIVDAPSALEKIDSIKVRSFDFKSDGSHVEFGTIAQELYEVAPECVAKGDDNAEIEHTWGVDTSVLVPAMIKAIQELKAEVDALKAQLGK